MPVPKLTTTRETGCYGERVAANFLTRRGYKVLLRNYRVAGGEIDLVCRCGEMLVFVEVKSLAVATTDAASPRPADAIHETKRQRIRHAAQHYVRELTNPLVCYRFDAVEVTLTPGQRPTCHLLRDFFH